MCSSVFLFLLTGFCREQLETPMPVLIPTVAQGWIPRACPHTFLSSSSCHEHHELYLLSLCLSKESPRLAVLGTSHQAPPYLGALELLWNVLSATFLPTLFKSYSPRSHSWASPLELYSLIFPFLFVLINCFHGILIK